MAKNKPKQQKKNKSTPHSATMGKKDATQNAKDCPDC